MASELLVKRLLKQAGASVLAGLLLSSAVMAEDNSAPAGGDDSSVSVDGGPDVSVDPVGGGDWGGDDGGAIGGSDDGSDGGSDDGTGIDNGGGDDGTDGGSDADGSGDGVVGDDDGTVSLDPREWDGTFNDEAAQNTMADGPTAQPTRGYEPNQRGNEGAHGGSVSHEHDGSDARARWEKLRNHLR